MSNYVSDRTSAAVAGSVGSLFVAGGGRKYLTPGERERVLAAFEKLAVRGALFAKTLAWTGARPSEVLALTYASFDLAGGVVAIETLKRRAFAVRQVPLPAPLLAELNACFAIVDAQCDPARAFACLWPFGRTTAWRIVKTAMREARISGPPACPRGLRHGFGVGNLQAGVPIMRSTARASRRASRSSTRFPPPIRPRCRRRSASRATRRRFPAGSPNTYRRARQSPHRLELCRRRSPSQRARRPRGRPRPCRLPPMRPRASSSPMTSSKRRA